MKKQGKIIVAAITFLGAIGCSGSNPLSPFPSTYRESLQRELISYSDEMRSSAQSAAAESERDCKVMPDRDLQAQLNRVMAKLLREVDSPLDGASISPVACSQLNAFSFVPARRIYILKGLLDVLDTEDELAFVIAHEISHHYQKVGSRIETREALAQRVQSLIDSGVENCRKAKALEATSPWKTDYQQCLNLVRFQALSQIRANSRLIETETDQYALDLLRRAGYREAAAKTVLTKIAGKDGFDEINSRNWGSILLATHPRAKERLEDVAFWEALK